MKITDFSLIFIAIIIPYMLVLYINVTFTIKAEEQELYYQNMIDAAVDDAAYEMKQIESADKQIDYGYSGTENKKINVNAKVGVDAFFDSMYNTLGIKGNEAAQSYFNLFVPAVAIVEYDGVRVSQNETVIGEDGSSIVQRVLRPKRYFSYTYTIARVGGSYIIADASQDTNVVSKHTIDFTMDDRITHRGYNYIYNEEIPVETFYLTDAKNNENLISGVADSDIKNEFKSKIVSQLLDMRKSVISNVVSSELSYSTNANNLYARQAGVTYSFSFPATTEDEMYNMIDGVGIIAFVQGISIGNKYLNTKAIGVSTLDSATRYYFTAANSESQVHMNLYHKDINCPEYRIGISKVNNMSPRYVTSRQEAATSVATGTLDGIRQTFEGFYPCPICNP